MWIFNNVNSDTKWKKTECYINGINLSSKSVVFEVLFLKYCAFNLCWKIKCRSKLLIVLELNNQSLIRLWFCKSIWIKKTFLYGLFCKECKFLQFSYFQKYKSLINCNFKIKHIENIKINSELFISIEFYEQKYLKLTT